MALAGKQILLIVSGGIAAYKAAVLVRRLKDAGATVVPILTKGGAQFITPLTLAGLAEHPVYQDLFSLKDESEMGHIRLAREADLILVAPASADLIGRMAAGLADDLASTTLLAADGPVAIAPSMNPVMWANPATQANVHALMARGVHVWGPADGDMACGEIGSGRLTEPEDLVALAEAFFAPKPLAGKLALVTSGPTHEPVDPVRVMANRSSGQQGQAVAAALAAAGADVTLVTGPVSLPPPVGVHVQRVETADDMLAAAQAALPADIAVFAAAVADWKPKDAAPEKLKKQADRDELELRFVKNPDILATIAQGNPRPGLVVGFAAETENLVENARAKRQKKQVDWILANDVSGGAVFGAANNAVTLVTGDGADAVDTWPELSKSQVAARLVARIVEALEP
ncbi:MAG: bifunctional phosphopantothenoylcysteine decarboxylase/phosphopantothenate--cysteine ligase CoaBC [Alphaproteobacteria bacterium]|nr:bifunctional phosphopantothenoylcysteine decarboxylase/phosphopantothenate--cysteine ligase CoaBC [Alphaproteobacteria bacterium]